MKTVITVDISLSNSLKVLLNVILKRLHGLLRAKHNAIKLYMICFSVKMLYLSYIEIFSKDYGKSSEVCRSIKHSPKY